ncbi:putative aldolase class 2 protein [Nymphon striatum]|nr:putative aldolase class 2 protein [Nymphon striatum]
MPVGSRYPSFWCVPNWDNVIFWRLYEWYMLTLVLLIPFTVMSVAYFIICIKVWAVMKQRSGMSSSSGKPQESYRLTVYKGSRYQNSMRQTQMETKLVPSSNGVATSTRIKFTDDNSNLKQIIKMLLAVVVLFLFSWTPLLILNLLTSYEIVPELNIGFTKYLRISFRLIAYANSSINPVVYGFMSKSFRDSIKIAFRLMVRGRQMSQFNSSRSTRNMSLSGRRSAPSHSFNGKGPTQYGKEDPRMYKEEDYGILIMIIHAHVLRQVKSLSLTLNRWRVETTADREDYRSRRRHLLSRACVENVEIKKYLDGLDENQRVRVKLATAYRSFDYFNLNEGICNHLSALAPAKSGNGTVMFLVPYGLHWSEVTPSKLVGVNDKFEVVEGDGQPEVSAMCIHKGIYAERKGTSSIMHSHPPYATALSLKKNTRVKPLHQSYMYFHNNIAYNHTFDGVVDTLVEGNRLGKVLKDKHTLMMGNHGVLVASDSIEKAFVLNYYLERICMFQVYMDWNLCVICQERGGDLRCPTDSLQKNGLEVYTNFLETVDKFSELGILPVDVDFKEVAIAETFLENHAKWHKSCHIKFARSKLQRAQKQIEVKQKCEEEVSGEGRQSKRQSIGNPNQEACIFCLTVSGKMHRCSTMNLDHELRRWATELNDTALLARISGGDLVAIEAKYHYDCLSLYKNRHRSAQRASHSYAATNESRLQEARAFAEFVSYIECSVENGNYIFKLSELHGLYVSRLHNLGVDKPIHKTRLKIQLLGHFLDGCQEQSDGKNILLVFNEGLKKILKQAVDSRDFEAEAISMVKLVKAVREEIFDWKLSQFTGSFKHNCQEESVPTSLKSLISMLLNGPNVTGQDETETQACLTISQLIHFNAKNKAPVAKKSRHSKKREPPLPLYVGLNVHTLTRRKNLVNKEGLVCPSQLRKDLFTVGALDNIDYNPSSTTAKDSFHGTGISIFQFPTATNPGKCSYPIVVQSKVSSSEYSLPESYTTVPAVDCKISQLTVPEATITEIEGQSVISKGSSLPMSVCDHEEVDSRICVHIQDALKKGARTILVRTVDTDVIVILVGLFFNFLSAYHDIDLWVAFGMGKHFQYYNIKTVCQNLGSPNNSKALPIFHVFTGSDTTSQFAGKGKKSAWEAWKSYPEVTSGFLSMVEHPFQLLDLNSATFRLLDRFTCVLYNKTTAVVNVNELRQELFSKKTQAIEKIPPTQILAESTGDELLEIPEKTIAQDATKIYENGSAQHAMEQFFYAMIRNFKSKYSDFI